MLTEPAISGLKKITKRTGTDCWFKITSDRKGYRVYDIENECFLSWEKALSDLNDAIIDAPSEYRLSKEEITALADLFVRIGLKNSLTEGDKQQ